MKAIVRYDDRSLAQVYFRRKKLGSKSMKGEIRGTLLTSEKRPKEESVREEKVIKTKKKARWHTPSGEQKECDITPESKERRNKTSKGEDCRAFTNCEDSGRVLGEQEKA